MVPNMKMISKEQSAMM